MTKPRRNFDLPAKHIDPTPDLNWAPPRSRDPEEIARRQGMPSGTILREFQASGANVAKAIFDHPMNEPEDISHVRRNLARTLLNTSWYVFADSAKNPDIYMRRELKLPVLADDSAEWRATKEGLLTRVRQGLGESAALSSRLAIQYREGHDTARVRTEKKLGRTMGNTALTIISLQHANAPLGMSEHEIQDIVMLDASELLEDARLSYQESGAHMSVAQLADPYSPLSVSWRKTAPRSGESLEAIEQAQSDFGRSL